MSHAGAGLLADLTDTTTPTERLPGGRGWLRRRPFTIPGSYRPISRPIADDDECMNCIAALGDQPGPFGPGRLGLDGGAFAEPPR